MSSMCQRQVSESQTAMSGAASPICSNRRRPTSTAIWRFSTFRPYVPADPAADRVVLDHAQPRDEVEQVERRLADAVALLLAGRVVGDGHRHLAEVGAQLAAVVQVAQQLADVVGALGDEAQLGVVLGLQDLAAPRA